MSTEEDMQYMKQKLYNNFKDAGLLDNLKVLLLIMFQIYEMIGTNEV